MEVRLHVAGPLRGGLREDDVADNVLGQGVVITIIITIIFGFIISSSNRSTIIISCITTTTIMIIIIRCSTLITSPWSGCYPSACRPGARGRTPGAAARSHLGVVSVMYVMYMYVYIYIYIYIHRDREMCVYIYIFFYL